ncbi:N-acetylglucosamine kinase [Pantoea rodasii]|uniref:N-acetyl-D-glucosamine kinase n=1 Tax=Pantoea rodasii TaxID=1076549 RepID=A0A2M9W8P6_9GAMM|nr:ROK family protein [Pantoea rodasii]ORM63659.1 N-acetylglucosamine kinase [Pantoea rodasii]PJZ03916.1 N-acetylglucosamine kinase [Pantoea rodasii]
MSTTPAVICLDLGGSFVKLGVMDAQQQLTILDQQKIPADSWPEFIALISRMIEQHQTYFTADSPLAISTAGIVAPDTGEIFASNIPAFHQRNLSLALGELLHRKVIVHNDADCFTLAEAQAGVGKGHKVVFGAILGSGVGGGLVADGRIITGQNGLTGEWGHGPITLTEIDIEGETVRLPRQTCPCGQKGCLDSYGGARGLENLHRTLHQVSLSSIDIIQGWQQQDAQAQHTILVWLELVSQPLAYTINITGASLVAVGGGLASVTLLINALNDHVQRYVLRRTTHPLVVPGAFAHNGGMMGAALLARQVA